MKLGNKPMKRLSLYLFLILFTLQTPSWADDIRDFQIEGMSIGDSALDYFSEKKINNGTKYFYKNEKFQSITLPTDSSTYEKVDFTIKPKDKKYKIYSVRGSKNFNKLKDCKIVYNEAVKELSEMFKNSKKVDAGKRDYAVDPTGKSKIYNVYFWLESGGFIEVTCFDLTKELAKQQNWNINNLTIGIVSKEFSDFLLKEEYK